MCIVSLKQINNLPGKKKVYKAALYRAPWWVLCLSNGKLTLPVDCFSNIWLVPVMLKFRLVNQPGPHVKWWIGSNLLIGGPRCPVLVLTERCTPKRLVCLPRLLLSGSGIKGLECLRDYIDLLIKFQCKGAFYLHILKNECVILANWYSMWPIHSNSGWNPCIVFTACYKYWAGCTSWLPCQPLHWDIPSLLVSGRSLEPS